jgi:hypothetical protein
MKHTSTYLAVSANRIFTIRHRKIHSTSINSLFKSACVTLWYKVANFRVIGPYFFEDEDIVKCV